MKVIVVIPTYNERENTEKMIDILNRVFSGIKDHKTELLYVDANSPDGTAKILEEKKKKYKWLHLLIEDRKEGLGRAYAKGMEYAMNKLNADYIMEFDGDFQHKPEDIPHLVAEINNGYDYIIGSRYVPGGSIPKEWGFIRKFLSIVGNLVARTLLVLPNIHDVTGGFKLSRVKGFMEEFDFSNLLSDSFAYKIHLLYYMINKGAKVKEVPIEFKFRTAGESKLIKNELIETLKVISLLQLNNPKVKKFIKFGIVGFTGFLINAIALELFRASNLPNSLSNSFSSFESFPFLSLFTNPNSWSGGLAAELSIISNFILNNFWTFSSEKITNPLRLITKFLQFNLTSLGAVVIQFIIIGFSTQVFGDRALVRQISLMLSIGFLIIPYNWFMYNKFIWKGKKPR